MSGLDIWASLLSTGAICTFYTTVVSDPSPHGRGLHAYWVGVVLGWLSTPYLPFLPKKPSLNWACFLIFIMKGDLRGSGIS